LPRPERLEPDDDLEEPLLELDDRLPELDPLLRTDPPEDLEELLPLLLTPIPLLLRPEELPLLNVPELERLLDEERSKEILLRVLAELPDCLP
jgi:hypothetical protein